LRGRVQVNVKWMIAAGVLGAGLLGWVWWSQPQQAVKRAADRLVELANLPDARKPVDQLFRADRLRGLCAPEVVVSVRGLGHERDAQGREEVLAAYQIYQQMMGGTQVRAQYGGVLLTGDAAELPMRLMVRSGGGGERVLEGRMRFRRSEGGWRLEGAEFVE